MSTAWLGVVVALAVAVPARADRENRVAEAQGKAAAQLQEGRAKEALRTLERLTDQMPTSPDAHLVLGRLQERIGGGDALERAARSFAKAVELSPAASALRGEAQGAAAALELRRGSGRDGLLRAKEAVEWKPTAEHLALLARAQVRTQDLDAALETADRAAQAGPSSGAAHESRGVALLALGRTDEAIAALRKALDVEPAYSRARVGLASALLVQGNAAEAAAEARKATAGEPTCGEAFAVLGLALLAEKPGQWDEAIAEAQQGAFLEPRNPVVLHAVGQIFEARDDWHEAVAAYERALTVDPPFVPVRLAVLRIQIRRGDLAGALVEARKIAGEAPQNGEAQLRFGELLFRKEAYADAVGPLQKAAERIPRSSEAHFILGRAYHFTKRIPDAVTEYGRAVQLSPHNPDYRLTYGLMLGVTGEPEKGIAELERLIETAPEKAVAARINIAVIYRSMKPRMVSESITAYLEALKLDPKNVQASMGLGLAYRFAEKWDEAIATYQGALELDAQVAAEAYTGIAQGYLKKDDLAQAKAYADKAAAAGADVTRLKDRIKAIEEARRRPPIAVKPRDLAAVQRLLVEPKNPEVRGQAARDMAAHGKPAVPSLVYSVVNDTDPVVREAVCHSLGAIGPAARSAVPYLRQILGTIPDPVLFPTREQIDAEGQDQDMRNACRKALQKIQR